MIKRSAIVACARTYLGTPFKHQGRIRGLALDCVGLPICVARDLGLNVPDYNNYGAQQIDGQVLRECKKHLIEIDIEAMQPGDVICCRIPIPSHTAIVSDLPPGLGMIHAYASNGKVVEHTIDFHWRKRIAGVFLFPGVED